MNKKQMRKFIDQSNDASGINSRRGMAKKAKRNTSKKIRREWKNQSK